MNRSIAVTGLDPRPCLGPLQAYQIMADEVHITTERAATNMAWQGMGNQQNCVPKA